MSKYDGPSYFKKRHPKIQPLKQTKRNEKETKKVSWVDQDNYFKNDHKNNRPNHVQTQSDLQEKALDYMRTPSIQSNGNSSSNVRANSPTRTHQVASTPKINSRTFRSKYIPKSLQNLDGWKTNSDNHTLIAEVKKRLEKETDTYLLFEEYLAPEVVATLKIEDSKKPSMNEPAQIEQPVKSNAKINQAKNKVEEKQSFDKQAKEKAERVQEELNNNLVRPNTGLHRSLSKIIAEDQEALKNRSNHLGSLFSDED